MDTLARRVATRFLLGSAFEPPAGMQEEIIEWVYAVVAATGLAPLRRELDHFVKLYQEQQDQLRNLDKALDTLQANPTNWKAYVAVHDLLGVLGVPPDRWKVTEFQKLTPEKKVVLQEKVLTYVKNVRERMQRPLGDYTPIIRKLEGEIADLEKYTRPGVGPMTGPTVERSFPIDLRGWVYANKRPLEEMVAQRTREEATKMRDMLLQIPDQSNKMVQDMLPKFEKRIQTGKGEWENIRVLLTTVPSGNAAASWQPALHVIRILVPTNARPESITRLNRSLGHELRHFGQDFFASALGMDLFGPAQKSQPGFPSKKIRTPEFKQDLNPAKEGFKETPEFQAMKQRLWDQGLQVKDVDFHALDDVEFYTELADSIDDFNALWQKSGGQGSDNLRNAVKLFTGVIPYPSRRQYDSENEVAQAIEALGGFMFVRHFSQPHRFFAALKRHAPGKHRKAVSELFKAVS